jgi:hypothetical protein
MSIRKTRSKLTALTVILSVSGIIWVTWGAGLVPAIQDSEDMPSPFGLARGQTARLNIWNPGKSAVVGPEYRFVDSAGRTLAQSEDRFVVQPGQFISFDLDGDSLPVSRDGFGRTQLRAVVTALGGPDTRLHISVEVFDNDTGKTTFVIGPTADLEVGAR